MSLWVGLLGALVSIAGAVGAVLALRRTAPPGGYLASPAAGSGIFGVLGTTFAVILAFVILLALQSYNTARSTAGQEALILTQMHRTASLLPEPGASTVLAQLTCYGRAVAEDEWPIMSEGRESVLVQGWLDEMGLVVSAMSPTTARETTAYAQWFERDTDRREGRRGRLLEAQPLVPTFLWVVLDLAAVLVIGCALLFADRRERPVVQALLVGSLTAVVALGLLVVGHLDRPYDSIAPSEMRRTLAGMETTRLAVVRAPLPCDERGAPLAAG